LQDRSTDFEFLPIDVSLGRCFRYYQKLLADSAYTAFGSGTIYGTDTCITFLPYKQQMRSSPSIAKSGTMSIQQGTIARTITSLATTYSGKTSLYIDIVASTAGLTSNSGAIIIAGNDANAFFELNSEL
jgi:hypothetical protein